MHLEGSMTIKAPRLIAWHFLTNPEAVSSCAPGVTINQIIIPNKKFTATVTAGFSDIKASFATEVEFTEMRSPDHAKFKAHGVAKNAAVDVTSEMSLKELPGGQTEMTWSADLAVVGKLVTLASGRMDMVTKQMTEEFFVQLKSQIEAVVSQRGFKE
jgi:carbon monoxide dehydrogenase subunit G